MQVPTRQILWNVPYWASILMQLLFFVSAIVCVREFLYKLRFVLGDDKLSQLKKLKLNWKQFFITSVTSGKSSRRPYFFLLHAVIVYAFLTLFLTTLLVAIHHYSPLHIFNGNIYIIFSFASDLAGLALLILLSGSLVKNIIFKSGILERREKIWSYILLLFLIISGFILEGIRIQQTGMPYEERLWSPIGWLFACLIKIQADNIESLHYIYLTLWMLHMAATMLLIVNFFNGFLFHMLAVLVGSLTSGEKPSAVLSPMNFDNENAEYFGLKKISDLNIKGRQDILSCIQCGRCAEVCPAYLTGKELNPYLLISKLRAIGSKNYWKGDNINLWEEGGLKNNEIHDCTTCGACIEECPAHIGHINIIIEAKRYQTLTLGSLPDGGTEVINHIKAVGNPWGLPHNERFAWNKGTAEFAKADKKVEYIYFVGCAGCYEPEAKKTVNDLIAILKRANISFALLGADEFCCGDSLRRLGDEYSYQEVVEKNIRTLEKYEFEKILVHCPHCFHNLGKEYTKFGLSKYRVIHHTSLIRDIINEGKIKINRTNNKKIIYHDPCYIGRHEGIFDAPRNIINSVNDLPVHEFKKNRDKSLCCGMGGGNMWIHHEREERVVDKKLIEVAEDKSEVICTACPYCQINFHSAKDDYGKMSNIQTVDIATLVANSL